jgi:hypothetical protein
VISSLILEAEVRYREIVHTLFCAWVLWVEHFNLGSVNEPITRQWVVKASYPENKHAKCIQDMKEFASREESKANFPNVQNIKRLTLLGDRESVTIEYKTGGSLSLTYSCLPDTVKPQ